jgi:hypothetical protein
MEDAKKIILEKAAVTEDKRETIKQECRKIVDHFRASSGAAVESREGYIIHLEFDKADKLAALADYLRDQGVLFINEGREKKGNVN